MKITRVSLDSIYRQEFLSGRAKVHNAIAFNWILEVTLFLKLLEKNSEEVGDCWEWTGALQVRSPTPVMRFQQQTNQVRRFIAQAKGRQLDGDRLVTCKCRNELCVNPDHVVVVSRKRLQEMIAQERQYQTNPVRMKKLAEKARLRSKLTPEQVEEIRNAEESQRAIAARYGITQGAVSSIKCGRTWKDYSNPFAALFGGRK